MTPAYSARTRSERTCNLRVFCSQTSARNRVCRAATHIRKDGTTVAMASPTRDSEAVNE
jgi:hypothetical protein